jgi:hypothetical protein
VSYLPIEKLKFIYLEQHTEEQSSAMRALQKDLDEARETRQREKEQEA